MNKVILIGNLTRDPELTQTPNGVSVCHFSIAVNRPYTQGGEKETDFFNCTAWRATGENIAKYQRKGSKVAVMGSIQLRNYEDNQGVKRTAIDIICQDVEFLSPKKDEDEYEPQPVRRREQRSGSSSRQGGGQARPVERRLSQLQAFEDDDDCPF